MPTTPKYILAFIFAIFSANFALPRDFCALEIEMYLADTRAFCGIEIEMGPAAFYVASSPASSSSLLRLFLLSLLW